MSSDEAFLERVAAALEDSGLDAVVVGNAGAILCNAPVLTDDVDLLMRDTPSNRRKLEVFARQIGGSRPSLVSELSSALRIFADVQVDVLFRIDGGKFESFRARSALVRVGDYRLRVASLRDIIRSKEVAARPKDLACLPILRDTLKVTEAAYPVPPHTGGKGRRGRRG